MSIDSSNINSYYFTTTVNLNGQYNSKEFYCKGATWVISLDNITDSNMEIKISYKGKPTNKSVRLSINNGNNNEYFNIDKEHHYIHNFSIDEFYDKGFCLYKFEFGSIENINNVTVGITFIEETTEYSYLQYISEKIKPENYILLPNISTFNKIYIHEINKKQYIYCKYFDQINKFNNFVEDYSDVIFEIGDNHKIIKAHRVILASRCPYFKTVFENAITENSHENGIINIKLPNENYTSFKALIDFLYKGKCYVPKSKKVMEDLLNLAYQYHINNLIEDIEDELINNTDNYLKDELEESFNDNNSNDIDAIMDDQETHLYTVNNSLMAKKIN